MHLIPCFLESFKFIRGTLKTCSMKHTKPSAQPKKIVKPKSTRKIDINSLNESFSEVHRTKMTKSAVQARKAAKIVPVKGKVSVPSRETVAKTSDELSKLLKDF